jgi:polyferredoxin
MVKIGQPEGLIAYDTEANVLRRLQGRPARFRFIRGRTILYAGILAAVASVMLFTLSFRHTLDLDVLRDRNPDYVTLADGAVRNGYTLKLMNRSPEARSLLLSVSGIKTREINVIGEGKITDSVLLPVEADKVRTLRVLVTVDRKDLAASHGLDFTLSDSSRKERREVDAVFVAGVRP